MPTFNLKINNETHTVEADMDTPLLWVLRDHLKLTGTKFGCGKGLCGACTVHLDGAAMRSCSLPVSFVAGKQVMTIEGLSDNGQHPLQQAWVAENAPQCGYCQSGQIMQAASLLSENPDPSDEQIVDAMAGNLCRCGTYNRILAAIERQRVTRLVERFAQAGHIAMTEDAKAAATKAQLLAIDLYELIGQPSDDGLGGGQLNCFRRRRHKQGSLGWSVVGSI